MRTNSTARMLFVDDEASILAALRRSTRKMAANCEFVDSPSEALKKLDTEAFDIVVSDMNMPEMSGVEFLGEVANRYPETVRIVLSGYSEHELIMDSVNKGKVWGYLQKPWDDDQLQLSLEQALFTRQLMVERLSLQRCLQRFEQYSKTEFQGFYGDSAAMQVVYRIIETAAPSKASIFITGSSGTGKELAAEAIHQRSRVAEGPFIALNCAAIPSELLESEVFGHVKGAFSGAVNHRDGAATLADGGTLFLDELGEMDISLQAKLLRFIQTGQFQKVGSSKTESVDIRFICATNRDPLSAISEGRLREDLYYRLNVISLDLPDLKERDWDVLLLANHFMQRFSEIENKNFVGFDKDAEELLYNYEWPGNVRQLENCIQSLVIMCEGPMIHAQEILQALRLKREDINIRVNARPDPISLQPASLNEHQHEINEPIKPLHEVERQYIEAAIERCGSNVVQAAEALEVSPSTLYRKMQQWKTADF